MNAIVTSLPYSLFLKEVVAHPIVSGIRLNTVMPVKDSLEDVLKRLQDSVGDKEFWVDLKCRQLRVKTYGVPPFTEIELTHEITVKTPVTAYFKSSRGGDCLATVLAVDKNRLIMQEGPQRVVGPGESVNIVDPSLKVQGYFTDLDLKYIEAGIKVGVKNYMLSFVESYSDIVQFKKLDSNATVIAKIESQKGMDYVKNVWKQECRLMAARGDLFIEVAKPHLIIEALETILKKDPNAIVASRIFDSFEYSLEPSSADIGDADNLMRMGYRTFMFGDEICMRRESILSGLNLLSVMAERYHLRKGDTHERSVSSL